jgi:N-acetylglucosaminyl-diphospho-decaprenol L-rhamnosyltransferase
MLGSPSDGSDPARVDVDVVIVTWRGVRHVARCLESLAGQRLNGLAIRVIVVDNASDDGTSEVLEAFPWAAVVRTEVNLGFAGGANVGIRSGTAPWVALVNDDATLSEHCLLRLFEKGTSAGASDVGAVTARIYLDTPHDGARVLNSTGNLVGLDGVGRDRDWLQRDSEATRQEDVFGFCGAAALLRRQALDDCGLFDASLFLYYEDTDLSWRMRLGGWRVVYADAAVAVHGHGQSAAPGSDSFLFYNWRNQLLCLTRNAPAWLVVREVLRTLGKCILAPIRSPGTATIRRKALSAYVRMLPAAVRQRRDIGRRSVVPRRKVADLRCRP